LILGLRDRLDHSLRSLALKLGARLAAFPGHFVYLSLAMGVAVWSGYLFYTGQAKQLSAATYDQMMEWRWRLPKPDPEIVILDIDERSLAAMAPEFGRWPWPRDVLAAVVSDLERQGARALVFDVLFSDPDVRNPGGERAFSDAVAGSRSTYFPVLRLDRGNDSLSTLRAVDLPGLFINPANGRPSQSDATIALTVPYFEAVIRSTRLGTFNIRLDDDNVVRRYDLWEDLGKDARLLSLPARIALDQGWRLPKEATHLVNWPRGAPAHQRESFSDYFIDTQRRQRQRPADEFSGKIVLIGATAPALGDQIRTPMSKLHPGVDLLATVIDNVRNDSLYRELSPLVLFLISTVMLGAMTWATLRFAHDSLSLAFLVAPGALLAVTYLTMNLSHWFIDLSVPASMSLLYFSLAKVYATNLNQYWSGEHLYERTLDESQPCWAGTLAIQMPEKRRPGHERHFLDEMAKWARSASLTPSTAGGLGWMTGHWKGTVLLIWVASANDRVAIDEARKQAQEFLRVCTNEYGGSAAGGVGLCEGSTDKGVTVLLRRLGSRSLAGNPETPAIDSGVNLS